jgi:serine protease AprX
MSFTRRTVRRTLATFVAALACSLVVPALASAAFVPPPLLALAQAHPSTVYAVIFLGQPGVTSQQLKEHVRAAGGQASKQYSVVRAVDARLTYAQLLALRPDTAIRSITPDGRVKGQSAVSGSIWQQAANVTPLYGTTGQAPAIAVVDSGVDATRTADFGVRITAGQDFTGGSGSALTDANGHGTLVAGIAAGSSAAYPGASPTSNIISLRVVHTDGSAYVSDVLGAADWIYSNRVRYGIGVANFSLRSSFANYANYDPLNAAVRRLWLTGTVVVASAGNSGHSRMVYAPVSEPFIITVGASDIADTVARGDDGAAPWTSYGYTGEGFAKPELGAPGRWMIGPVSSGGGLAGLFADRIVEPGYMWMSGTSFAAPVVSGAAAQVLARHPTWTPDQVKGALMKTATTAPLATQYALGAGEVDATAAAAVTNPPNPNASLYAYVKNDAANGNVPYFDWDLWKSSVAQSPLWDAASWTDASWTDASWTDASWTDASWTDASWTDASWTDASWTDASWTDASWTDASWTDASWTDASWTDASWTDASWTDASWTDTFREP